MGYDKGTPDSAKHGGGSSRNRSQIQLGTSSPRKAPSAKTDIIIRNSPSKLNYAPGDPLDFSGLSVGYGDKDVTSECSFSVPQGSRYPKDEEFLDVIVTYACEDGSASTTMFKVYRKAKRRSVLPWILLAIAIMALIAAVVLLLNNNKEDEPQFPQGDTGTYIIPQGDMTDEEAQAMLDEMTEKSRITISVAPEMQLKSDGSLRVNMIVPQENNGLSERIEIEQEGKVVYASGVIPPGNRLEWGSDSKASVGPATATIYAVSSEGDFGNPTSVEVTIVAAKE